MIVQANFFFKKIVNNLRVYAYFLKLSYKVEFLDLNPCNSGAHSYNGLRMPFGDKFDDISAKQEKKYIERVKCERKKDSWLNYVHREKSVRNNSLWSKSFERRSSGELVVRYQRGFGFRLY